MAKSNIFWWILGGAGLYAYAKSESEASTKLKETQGRLDKLNAENLKTAQEIADNAVNVDKRIATTDSVALRQTLLDQKDDFGVPSFIVRQFVAYLNASLPEFRNKKAEDVAELNKRVQRALFNTFKPNADQVSLGFDKVFVNEKEDSKLELTLSFPNGKKEDFTVGGLEDIYNTLVDMYTFLAANSDSKNIPPFSQIIEQAKGALK